MAAWFEIIGSVGSDLHDALLAAAIGENHSGEANRGHLAHHTKSVYAGTALWAIYGLLLNNRPVLFANAVTLVFAVTILILKIRYR